jgi:hypothetical protein
LVLLVLCVTAWAAPVLEVDRTEWKMGKVPHNERRTSVFTLRNTGDEPLLISQIRPSCVSCLGKMEGDSTLQPGESRPLEVSYQAVDAYGQHTMSVTIHSNDPEKPLLRLRLSVEVVPQKDKPVLTVRPATIDVGVVVVGKPTKVSVVLANEGGAPLDVRSVVPSAGCQAPEVSKDAVAPAGEMAITVEVLPRTTGVIQESIGFETNDPERPSVVVPIQGYAQAAEPFGTLKAPESASRRIEGQEPKGGVMLIPRLRTEPDGGGGYQLSFANLSELSITVTFPGLTPGLGSLVLAPGAHAEKVIPLPRAALPSLVVQLVIQPAVTPVKPAP